MIQSLRRDLSDLAPAGQLQRVHDGAIFLSGSLVDGCGDRRGLYAGETQASAQACIAQILDGVSVFLTIGTSTDAVTRALLSHSRFLIVTNIINVASVLSEIPEAEVIVTGNYLRWSGDAWLGLLASDPIRQFMFDFTVFGGSPLEQDSDFMDFDFKEVTVSQIF